MTRIDLHGVISLATISTWPSGQVDTICFRITRAASFELFAEGVAVSLLGHYVRNSIAIQVDCTFDPIDGTTGGIFASLFGLSLAQHASHFRIETDQNALTNHIERVRQALWTHVLQSKGEIGDGKRRTIVFRDPDYVVPECLTDDRSDRFPLPSKFATRLVSVAKSMGVSDDIGASTAERSLVNFLYEASRNSHEHGRIDETGRGVRGIRGIIFEKLVFASQQELQSRSLQSASLSKYLNRVWEQSSFRKILLSVTVTDVGVGIQNTLQPLEKEDSWNRLLRAVFTPASRNPTPDEMERGRGLPKIVEAASRLGAFLLISSGELHAYCDYLEELKYPESPILFRFTEGGAPRSIGTSISIVWPIVAGGGDQMRIFKDS